MIDIRKDGQKAYYDYEYGSLVNKPLNPYENGTIEYQLWLEGWESESASCDRAIRWEQHNYHSNKFSSY